MYSQNRVRTAPAALALWNEEAPNPVLLSLQLASACLLERPHFARDSVVAERLATASNLLEHIASGLLHCAVRATKERMEVNKSFNPWRTGVAEVDPTEARDFFTQSSLSHAADYDLKVFLSNPFVAAYMLDTFWPTAGPPPNPSPPPHEAAVGKGGSGSRAGAGGWTGADGGIDGGGVIAGRIASGCLPPLRATCACSMRMAVSAVLSALLHVLALPAMLFLPRALELEVAAQVREHINKPGTARTQQVWTIFWFFPAGRLALWAASNLGLAWIATFMPPAAPLSAAPTPLRADGGSTPPLLDRHELALLAYLLGWALAELSEGLGTGQLQAYLRDPFNLTDLMLIAGMLLTLLTRIGVVWELETHVAALWLAGGAEGSEAGPTGEPSAALAALGGGSLPSPGLLQATMLPCQAVTAMLAWLRLLQLLFISPRYGPLLIMAVRMLDDLMQFVVLAFSVIAAFGAAFYVLVSNMPTTRTCGPLPLQRAASPAARADCIASADGHLTPHALATSPPASRQFNGAAILAADGVADDVPSITFVDVLTILMEGTMDGEPDRIMSMQGSSAVSRFAWGMMALFGVVVVLLLLNLLIARFAKTFDLVHEDLAGTFQVAFARVALKGAGLQAIPPPFNLVRGVTLALYAAPGMARELAQHGCAAWLAGATYEALHETETSEEQTASIVAFLAKATSAEVRLYPDAVEAWVKHHQFDYAHDERWRTSMNKRIAQVADQVDAVRTSLETMQGTLSDVLQAQRDLALAYALPPKSESPTRQGAAQRVSYV